MYLLWYEYVRPLEPTYTCISPLCGKVVSCGVLLVDLLQVDYLIGCHWDPASNQLLLMAGSSDGTAAFFPLMEEASCSRQLPAGVNPVGAPAVTLHGCHDSVVRSVECFEGAAAARLFCVSSGEDARIGLWTLQQEVGPSPSASMESDGSQHSGGPARQKHAAAKRHSPY
jgi:hypothetical protein